MSKKIILIVLLVCVIPCSVFASSFTALDYWGLGLFLGGSIATAASVITYDFLLSMIGEITPIDIWLSAGITLLGAGLFTYGRVSAYVVPNGFAMRVSL
ncbi:MAG: hypothetical protein HUK23_04755 [Sphaerochaetaceae bacterium]|nr:hypothetical protein [Sphaerochaetaceae bacterium]